MSTAPSLGLRRIEALHHYVHDLERSRRFYVERLGFAEVARSGPGLERAGRQRSAVFDAGGVRVICSTPVGDGGRAWRWLRRHPDGVGSVVLEVEDAERCFRLLEERGGTPVDELVEHRAGEGRVRTFSITTPLADATLRFVERRDAPDLYPGFVPQDHGPGGSNPLELGAVDHLTCNFLTMKPALLWMEHVLGLEELWEASLHTGDPAGARRGSGLRSVVMHDPASGIAFACNEPRRPAFATSQVAIFTDDHRGDGIQHAALTVRDIVEAVRAMRARGVEFMETPGAYYDALPERLRASAIGRIDEDLASLRELGILVDGDGPGSYLLQIFLREAAGLYRERGAGPFFYEIIQRKGDRGFGVGNFRALFESIERDQAAGRD